MQSAGRYQRGAVSIAGGYNIEAGTFAFYRPAFGEQSKAILKWNIHSAGAVPGSAAT